MAGPVQLAGDFDDLCLGSADARREACLVAGTGGGRCFIGRGRLDPLEVDLVDGEQHADDAEEPLEHLSHELIVRLQARPPSRLLCLVLGDGSVDLGFLDLLGGCAVPQGLERVVLVHRNHDSGFATETDDVVTVVLRRLHAMPRC
jgi:hypothetical protein